MPLPVRQARHVVVRFLLLACLLLSANPARAQYDPRAAFAPFDMQQAVNGYRSANGLPGPPDWQNRADYEIHAKLTPAANAPTLSGSEVITYTNNSPDQLADLWLQLDQNIYKPDSRAAFAGGWPHPPGEGFVLDKVEVETGGAFAAAPALVSDTRLRVSLPRALAGGGAKLRLRIAWHFAIPAKWGGRMGAGMAKAGVIYDMAQWYPRMAVYDDIRGWDTLPYLAQEFYLEYGNFDYFITLPGDMLVAGSGELVTAREVLTAQQQAQLARARGSDATVMIRSPDEVGDVANHGDRTWHFHMNDTRDVAFSASSVFVWDAARINLPGGKQALAMSFYPAESAGHDAWGRSTEYVKASLEAYSQRWYPYPWPVAINVAGPVGGMEYPGIIFDSIEGRGKQLFWITAHEIGHSYFPMIVGFDERRHAWMDEGFNTFIDIYESDDFNHGEYAPKRDPEYTPGGGNPVDEILPLLADPDAPAILTRADSIPGKYRHPVSYFKSALGLVLLREQILGRERFDPAFRAFIAAWAYKHPQPADFFRAMESAGGEDLSWWWRGWYANNWALDLAVDAIAPVDGDPAKGTRITVGSHGKLVMPATLRISFADATHRDYRLPAESWILNSSTSVIVPPGRKVVSALIDPDHALPDRNRTNNAMPASP